MLSHQGSAKVMVHRPAMPARRPEGSLPTKIQAFFAYAESLALSEAETRTLLDIGSAQLAQLRHQGGLPLRQDGQKLERRVDYALPLLQRMVAAAAH